MTMSKLRSRVSSLTIVERAVVGGSPIRTATVPNRCRTTAQIMHTPMVVIRPIATIVATRAIGTTVFITAETITVVVLLGATVAAGEGGTGMKTERPGINVRRGTEMTAMMTDRPGISVRRGTAITAMMTERPGINARKGTAITAMMTERPGISVRRGTEMTAMMTDRPGISVRRGTEMTAMMAIVWATNERGRGRRQYRADGGGGGGRGRYEDSGPGGGGGRGQPRYEDDGRRQWMDTAAPGRGRARGAPREVADDVPFTGKYRCLFVVTLLPHPHPSLNK